MSKKLDNIQKLNRKLKYFVKSVKVYPICKSEYEQFLQRAQKKLSFLYTDGIHLSNKRDKELVNQFIARISDNGIEI